MGIKLVQWLGQFSKKYNTCSGYSKPHVDLMYGRHILITRMNGKQGFRRKRVRGTDWSRLRGRDLL